MRNAEVQESDSSLDANKLRWLGAVCDIIGSVRIEGRNTNCPYLVHEFKSPFLDLLETIRGGAGGLGSLPLRPEKPSKNQKRPQYRLTFRGSHYHVFCNMVMPFMMLDKRIARFTKVHNELSDLRKQKGLMTPYRLLPHEDRTAPI